MRRLEGGEYRLRVRLGTDRNKEFKESCSQVTDIAASEEKV